MISGAKEGGLSEREMLNLRDQVERLRCDFDSHAADEAECMRNLMISQSENTKEILRTNQMLVEQKADTKELIQLFKDGQAMIRVGSKLGKFVRWVIGLGSLGIVLKWLTTHI